MLILHFIPSFSGGGAEKQLSLLASQQVEFDCEIHIAYLYSGVNIDLVSKKVFLHQIKCKSNYDPSILLKIHSLIKKINPSLVQTWLPQMDILVGFVCLLSGQKFVMTERSSSGAYKSKWRMLARDWVASKAAAIVANSRSGGDYWSKYSDKVLIISNGIKFQSNQQPCKTYEDKQKNILYAGRFSYEKNISFLLEGLNIILRDFKDYKAILSGEGPFFDTAGKIIEGLAIKSNFKLTGYDPNLQDSLRDACIFVSASHFEGFPNVVLEAMTSGCPLVVSDIPEHREILTSKMALFFNPNSLEDFTDALKLALMDCQGAMDRAALAKEHSYRYKIEKSASAYHMLYANLIKECGK